jgi:hypothetical protein
MRDVSREGTSVMKSKQTRPDCPSDLERTEELFAFLQGGIPEGYRIDSAKIPHLTPGQAWTVVWYLGNVHWKVCDEIERCDVCGGLFDTASEGTCLDFGDPPYHFCDNCLYSQEYIAKSKTQRKGKLV